MKIIVPGRGMMPVGYMTAAKAVEDYDPELILGFNEATTAWVVYKRRNDGFMQPVLGLGRGSEPPSREAITEKLYKADVRRNGARIVDQIERRNARIQQEARAQASEAAGEFAEYLAAGYRKEGFNPFPQVFIPKGVKSVER